MPILSDNHTIPPEINKNGPISHYLSHTLSTRHQITKSHPKRLKTPKEHKLHINTKTH